MTGRKLGYNPLNTIPRDPVAKRVVFDKGDHYDPNVKANSYCFSTSPLPVRNTKSLPSKVINDPNFKDYTGFKFGNFTVLGLFELHKFDKWVVQCCCGYYEIRRTSTLRKNPSAIDQTRCQSCLDLERLRNRDFFKENGYYPWQTPKNQYQKDRHRNRIK